MAEDGSLLPCFLFGVSRADVGSCCFLLYLLLAAAAAKLYLELILLFSEFFASPFSSSANRAG